MSRRLLALAVGAALVCLAPGAATAAAVTANGFRVSFDPPRDWQPARSVPEGVLALYKPKGPENFPHLAVTEADAGDGRGTLSRIRKSLPKLFGELGIDNPRPILSPKLVAPRGTERVDFAYSGEIEGLSLDWFQTIVPGAKASIVFTFALPKGTFDGWRPKIDAFLSSLRASP